MKNKIKNEIMLHESLLNQKKKELVNTKNDYIEGMYQGQIIILEDVIERLKEIVGDEND